MEDIQKQLEILSNKSYIFSVNTLSFVKSLQKAGYHSGRNNKLLQLAGKLADILLETADKTDKEEILSDLKLSEETVDTFFNLMQDIKTNGALANEKADLHIDAFKLRKELQTLILTFLT